MVISQPAIYRGVNPLNNIIANNAIQNVGGCGIVCNPAQNTNFTYPDNWVVSGNTIYACYCGIAGGTVDSNISYVGNTITLCTYGIYITRATNGTIANNVMMYINTIGIYLANINGELVETGFTVTGNTVSMNPTYSGVGLTLRQFATPLSKISITGNSLSPNTGTGAAVEIVCSGAPTHSDFEFVGNTVGSTANILFVNGGGGFGTFDATCTLIVGRYMIDGTTWKTISLV